MENQENQQEPTTNKTSPALWVSIILVIIVLAVGAYFIFTQEETTNTNNANTTVNAVTNTNSTTNVNLITNSNTNTAGNTNSIINTNSVDIDGWITYQNTSYNYSINYPAEWYSKELTNIDSRTLNYVGFGPEQIAKLGDSKTKISFSVVKMQLNNGFTPADISAEFEIQISSSETSEVFGKNAIAYTATAGETTTKGFSILYDSSNNTVFHIVVTNEEYFDIFDQAVSSLTFK